MQKSIPQSGFKIFAGLILFSFFIFTIGCSGGGDGSSDLKPTLQDGSIAGNTDPTGSSAETGNPLDPSNGNPVDPSTGDTQDPADPSGGDLPVAPNISLSSNDLFMGNVVLDQFSDRSVEIQNTGGSPLIIGQIAQIEQVAVPFMIQEDGCSGITLQTSETCSIKVRFSPSEQTFSTDSFDIPSNDPDQSSLIMNVTGNGKGLNVIVNQIDLNNCPTVGLVVSVLDKNNQPITGLTPDNFTIRENGNIMTINPATFTDQILTPISVGLALDNSETMAEVLPQLNSAVINFINLLKDIDEAAIVKFAQVTHLAQEFTTDKTALQNAVNDPYPYKIEMTKLHNAIRYTIGITSIRTTSRQCVVVIADGENTVSLKTLPDLVEQAKSLGIAIFTIGLGDVNAEPLQLIAEGTGGQYFLAPDSDGLESIYNQISTIISNQYLIEFESAGGPSILEIEVNYDGLEGDVTVEHEGC